MPIYQFKDNDTEEVIEVSLRIAELDEFKKDHPNLTQMLTALNFGNVGGIKTDDGWKEHMSRIAEAHPSSALASEYGKKDPKTVKTREVVEKWRSKRT